MFKRLSKLTVSKSVAIAMVLVLAIMPWFQGGRDPVGWMVLLGMALLGSFFLWRSSMRERAGRLGLAWLGFVGWTALSLIWSVNRYDTFTALMLEIFVGIAALLAMSLRSDEGARWAFERSYLIIASIASLVGIYIFVFQSYERATSTFYMPNPFAAFLLPAIVIGLWRFAEKQRLSEGLIAMLNLGVFILTDSRGATLALLVAVFVGLWLSKNLLKHWRRLLIILAGAVALSVLVNLGRGLVTHHVAFQGERYQQIVSSGSFSTSDRLYFIKSAIAIWVDHPLLGSGAGTFATLHPHYQYRVISAGISAHNYYVQVLAELGLVGLLLLLVVLAELFLGVLRGLKHDPSKLPYALALLALLVHNAVDIDALYPVLWILAVVLAGFCYLPAKSAKQDSELTAGAAVGLAASLMLALPTIWLFQNQAHAANASDLQSYAEYTKAAQYYQLSVNHPPYNPDWLTAQGINYLALATGGTETTAQKSSDLAKALDLAKAAQRLDPDDAQHVFLQGRVLYEQKQLEPAAVAYRAAIAIDPYDHPEYYNDLASVYLQQNKLAAAAGSVNLVLGMYSDAVIVNRNADATLKSNLATSYALAAQIALVQGDQAKARSDVLHGLKLDPNNLLDKLLIQRIGQ